VFNYGCLVWILGRSGLSISKATLFGGSMVLGIRLIQVFLPGRSAEITDLLMVMIIAAVMKLLSNDEVLPIL